MVKQATIVKFFFKYLKCNKGQGLVEGAAVLLFCIVVGLAAREAGLLDVLTDTYSDKVVIALGSSGITTDTGSGTGAGSGTSGSGSGTSSSGSGTSGSGNGDSGSGSGTSGSGNGDSGSGSGTSGSGNGDSGSGNGDSGSGSGTSGSGNGDSGSGSGTGSEGGSGSTPGIPAGGSTGGNDIVILASTPAGATTILQQYADYAKDHNLQQWQAVDPAWTAYQADGSPLGITNKNTFANVIIYNWKAANADWTSWDDISGSDWQWSEIKRYYETWKNNNSH